MAGIPEQRCEANADAEAQGAAPAALGADEARFMRRAIELAWRGWGWTNPNPLVGCVLVRDGRIIGEGWHEKCGQAHAERNALADCARRAAVGAADAERADDAPAGDPARGHARGATAYVTLEPCCHTGKQPPCTEALIAAGVARVVVGSRDPNPLVAGKGSARLREAGIRVDEDALRGECDELNPVFFRFISRKTPYVVAKWAMSADGKIACASGDARWVSGPESRRDTHELRHRLAAIAVGIDTVMADDPLLTCRREGEPGNQPLRVVLDSRLRIPEDCALVRSCAPGRGTACSGDLRRCGRPRNRRRRESPTPAQRWAWKCCASRKTARATSPSNRFCARWARRASTRCSSKAGRASTARSSTKARLTRPWSTLPRRWSAAPMRRAPLQAQAPHGWPRPWCWADRGRTRSATT